MTALIAVLVTDRHGYSLQRSLSKSRTLSLRRSRKLLTDACRRAGGGFSFKRLPPFAATVTLPGPALPCCDVRVGILRTTQIAVWSFLPFAALTSSHIPPVTPHCAHSTGAFSIFFSSEEFLYSFNQPSSPSPLSYHISKKNRGRKRSNRDRRLLQVVVL